MYYKKRGGNKNWEMPEASNQVTKAKKDMICLTRISSCQPATSVSML